MKLKEKYAEACEAYAARLDRLWDTDGWWLGDDDYEIYEVADCILTNRDVRYCVDNAIGWDEFYEWYQYNQAMMYGIQLGESAAHEIRIEHWFKGFPDKDKVPTETMVEWEKRYWDELKEL